MKILRGPLLLVIVLGATHEIFHFFPRPPRSSCCFAPLPSFTKVRAGARLQNNDNWRKQTTTAKFCIRWDVFTCARFPNCFLFGSHHAGKLDRRDLGRSNPLHDPVSEARRLRLPAGRLQFDFQTTPEALWMASSTQSFVHHEMLEGVNDSAGTHVLTRRLQADFPRRGVR